MNLTAIKDQALKTWDTAWNDLPIQARTTLNAAAGAGEAALVGYVVANSTHLSLTDAWQYVAAAVVGVLGAGLGTLATRYANPADNYPGGAK